MGRDSRLDTIKRSFPRFGPVLMQTGKDIFTDNITHWAAAVAYYSLLSVFPLLLAAISVAASFVDPQWATQKAMAALGQFLPRGEEFVRAIVQEAIAERGAASLVSTLLLLWTGSRGFSVLIRALNIAYDVDETYSYGHRLLVEVGMTLTLGVFFVLAVLSDFVLNFLWDLLQLLPAWQGVAFRAMKWLAPALLLFSAFFLTYRFVPRGRRHSKSALCGAVAATLLFLLARPIFFTYVELFARYNLIYGSIAAVITLLVWAWVVALIILGGGELASHIQMMLFEGRSAEDVDRRHAARARGRRRDEGRDEGKDKAS
ncbi:MAG: YihY/virulence factor BrkB family protein [Armatimonadota bacterium]|nr:YihY/virulence factor BrkB family protein [Armatimonadota bacterium]